MSVPQDISAPAGHADRITCSTVDNFRRTNARLSPLDTVPPSADTEIQMGPLAQRRCSVAFGLQNAGAA